MKPGTRKILPISIPILAIGLAFFSSSSSWAAAGDTAVCLPTQGGAPEAAGTLPQTLSATSATQESFKDFVEAVFKSLDPNLLSGLKGTQDNQAAMAQAISDRLIGLVHSIPINYLAQTGAKSVEIMDMGALENHLVDYINQNQSVIFDLLRPLKRAPFNSATAGTIDEIGRRDPTEAVAILSPLQWVVLAADVGIDAKKLGHRIFVSSKSPADLAKILSRISNKVRSDLKEAESKAYSGPAWLADFHLTHTPPKNTVVADSSATYGGNKYSFFSKPVSKRVSEVLYTDANGNEINLGGHVLPGTKPLVVSLKDGIYVFAIGSDNHTVEYRKLDPSKSTAPGKEGWIGIQDPGGVPNSYKKYRHSDYAWAFPVSQLSVQLENGEPVISLRQRSFQNGLALYHYDWSWIRGLDTSWH